MAQAMSETQFLQEYAKAWSAEDRADVIRRYNQALANANRASAYQQALGYGALFGTGAIGLKYLYKALTRGTNKLPRPNPSMDIDIYMPRYSELIGSGLANQIAEIEQRDDEKEGNGKRGKKRRKEAASPSTAQMTELPPGVSPGVAKQFYRDIEDSLFQRHLRKIVPDAVVNATRDPFATAATILLFGGGIAAGHGVAKTAIKKLMKATRARRIAAAKKRFDEAAKAIADLDSEEPISDQRKKRASSPEPDEDIYREIAGNCQKLAEIGFLDLIPFLATPTLMWAFMLGYNRSGASKNRKALDLAALEAAYERQNKLPPVPIANVKLPPEVERYLASQARQKDGRKKKRKAHADLLNKVDKTPVIEQKETVLESLPVAVGENSNNNNNDTQNALKSILGGAGGFL